MAKKKQNHSKVWYILGYIFATSLVIAGVTLVAVFWDEFEQYNQAVYWINHYTNGHGDFYGLLATYNSNAASHEDYWTYASIDVFAPGLTMLLFGLIMDGILIFFHRRSLKKNSGEPKETKTIKPARLNLKK